MLPRNPVPWATTSDGQGNTTQNKKQGIHYYMQPPGNQVVLLAGQRVSISGK